MPGPFTKDLEQLSEEDNGFLGVVSRLNPELVTKGYVSDAINRKFDNGYITNRWGVVRPVWGGVWDTGTRVINVHSQEVTQTVVSGDQIPSNRQIAVDPDAYCVTGVTVTSAGSGYTSAPTVTISGGGTTGSKSAATATASVSAGGVSSVNITFVGYGYTKTTLPTVAFSGGGGSGATATISTSQLTRVAVFQGGVTRCNSDDNTNVICSSKTLINFNGNRNAVFYDNTTTLGEIVGSCTYVDQRTGIEMLLVAVNEARSDGGNGNVYVIKPGQSHRTALGYSTGTAPLDMNGFDFYSTVRMIPCLNSVVMLRQGPERFYFKGNTVSSNIITTSVAHDLTTGNKVKFGVVPGSASSGPSDGVIYYVGRYSGTQITLHPTFGSAMGGSSTVTITATSSSDRYFLEVVEVPEFYTQQSLSTDNVSSPVTQGSNDARPIIMQATASNPNPLDSGFDAVPIVRDIPQTDVETYNYNASRDQYVLNSANHGLSPGDSIVLTVSSGWSGTYALTNGGTYYVFPVDQNRFRVYSTEAAALAGGFSLYPGVTGTGSFVKTGASTATIPNAREGCYFKNRLLLIYGRDNLAVSDVLDFMHYSTIEADYKLNTGTNDIVTAVYPFNETTLVVFKERSILAIENIYGDLSNVRLTELTREYGCIAPLSIASTGSDVVFLSTRGVATISQTQFGISQNVVVPLSDPIQDKIQRIDGTQVRNACGAYFNNRYIVSVPEEDGDGTNAMTLVFNFLNKAWEGQWNGDYLKPVQFNRLNCFGVDRLTWSDDSGFVHYFDDQALKDRLATDEEVEINTRVESRGYTCNKTEWKQWTGYNIGLETWNPSYSISYVYDGVGEETEVRSGVTKSRTDYYTYGTAAWNPTNANDDFLEPYRKDYSLIPGFKCKSGVKANLHQNIMEKGRMLKNANSVQLVLSTSQGSVKVASFKATAVPFKVYGQTNY
jgi:hypothetical protein